MPMIPEKLDNTMAAPITGLSDPSETERLVAISALKRAVTNGSITPRQPQSDEVNNHIHSWYSFSPYSPAMAAYLAWDAGLAVCGIVDHESVGGGKELLAASDACEIGGTVGCELRVHFFDTPFGKRRLNNPDMDGIAYTVIHGIAPRMMQELNQFLMPIRRARAERSAEETAALDGMLRQASLPPISFVEDVLPLSQYANCGSITERHILFACAQKLIAHCGRGSKLIETLRSVWGITPSARIVGYLTEEENPHYLYDLLGVLKSSLLPKIYISPTATECPSVSEVIGFAKSINAIPAYPYLGDVNESPTGDKAAQKFEDEILDQLFVELVRLGYLACTYMPPRNSEQQLKRIIALCNKHQLMEISGMDINSSRQEFLHPTPKIAHHLIDSAWALVAHERLVEKNIDDGLFSARASKNKHDIRTQIAHYAELGRSGAV